jgi:hypothetical protein
MIRSIRKRSPRRRALFLEQFEDRLTPSTFLVTSPLDDGLLPPIRQHTSPQREQGFSRAHASGWIPPAPISKRKALGQNRT